MIEPTELKTGDRVTWTHCTSNGSRIRFSVRIGVILRIEFNCALCKQDRTGRRSWVGLERLRPEGLRTELAEMVEDMTVNALKAKDSEVGR